MSKLVTRHWIMKNGSTLPQWQVEAFQELNNRLGDKENTYPCVPGRQGFLNGDMRFVFLSDPRNPQTRIELASSLKEYGRCAPQAGRYTSFVSLFETTPELTASYRVEGFEELFWDILSDLHRLDTTEWPDTVPADPEHFSWEFCFDSQPYFAFCTTPAHRARRSRYSEFFTVAFQPRFVFENINQSTEYGRKLKSIIRKRLSSYDEAPIHPSLGWYGQQDNLEWKQYFLRDNESTAPQCPFHSAKGMLPPGS